ncbi:sensor domain-containing diguanylate cyclase [Thiohalorhabdus sp.]|uniref:sensor domain-containing diguanylate cyclase n=1 Tax=Thiohalorhabdus sp. TaxID=3094134 RepID=UPI002FC291E7
MDSRPFAYATNELRHQFTNLLDSLSALRSLIETDTRQMDEATMLDQALQTLAEHQDLERSSVFLLRDGRLENSTGLDQREFAPGSRQRTSTATGPPTNFTANAGVMGAAATTGEAQHVGDCRQDPRYRPWGDERDRGAGALIAIPMMEGSQVIGVLNVAHPEPHAFSAWHEHMLQVFATMLSHMLLNHRLVNSLEEHVRQRTAQLEEALVEAEQLKTQFEQLAGIDELTTLYNRRFFFPEASAELARSLRHERPLTLLMIDLDHFKTINDVHGHSAGDQVLGDVAALFRDQLREGDILARVGGEEFVMMLTDTDSEGANRLAERLQQDLRNRTWSDADGYQFGLTASIGIAELHHAEESAAVDSQRLLDRLMTEADRAVYTSKAAGRDRITVYTE